MALPFFYIESIDVAAQVIILNEETSRHIVQVLRMQAGEQLQLTDGKGKLVTTAITDANRKSCSVAIVATRLQEPPARSNCIAISLIKNTNRFEWFLEKATELGITEIIPLLCARTEKQHFRYDRMKGILVSAMLQSQQCWLPVLSEPTKFSEVITGYSCPQKFVAHCIDGEKRDLAVLANKGLSSKIVLIGPEGDFTKEEVEQAVQHGFIPVSIGNTRLRTETAGIAASVLLTIR